MKRIFVSLINFNSSKNTVECLDSLEEIHKHDMDLSVIVIDNASREPLEIQVSKFKTFKIEIIRNSENLGFTGGHNLAIKHSLANKAEYILILNNDTRLDINLLTKLLKSIQANDRAGIAVPKIYFEKGYEYHKQKYKKEDLGKVIWYAGGIMDWENNIGKNKGVDEVDEGQFDKIYDTDFASGCCMLVKKDLFEEIGHFDEKFFLYYEDTDFSIRAKRANFKIIYQPEAILWHKNAGSSGGSGSTLQDYFISRNRLLFGYRYAPLRTKLALLNESIRILLNGRKWQRKGVIDFFIGIWGKGSYKV